MNRKAKLEYLRRVLTGSIHPRPLPTQPIESLSLGHYRQDADTMQHFVNGEPVSVAEYEDALFWHEHTTPQEDRYRVIIRRENKATGQQRHVCTLHRKLPGTE